MTDIDFDRIAKIDVVTDPESIGDIDPDYYHEMLEAKIAEELGGEYEYTFSLGVPGKISVELKSANNPEDSDDPADYEYYILVISGKAFEACCRGDAVPDV